jgi:hypothetical protein
VRGLERSDDGDIGINDVLEFTVYTLLPKEVNEWFLARTEPLDESQVAAVVEFLRHARERGQEYFGRMPRRSSAYWQSK